MPAALERPQAGCWGRGAPPRCPGGAPGCVGAAWAEAGRSRPLPGRGGVGVQPGGRPFQPAVLPVPQRHQLVEQPLAALAPRLRRARARARVRGALPVFRRVGAVGARVRAR